jgi:hypothetical protein
MVLDLTIDKASTEVAEHLASLPPLATRIVKELIRDRDVFVQTAEGELDRTAL